MKQLIQSYKTGELGLFDVPAPLCKPVGVVIENRVSLVSAGTEKMIVDIAKKSLLGKARARPDLVQQVLRKMKQEGVRPTLEKVFHKLDSPIPLGYSCAGRVIEVGSEISGIAVGDRVAGGGAGYANHSEVNYLPVNLFARIPDEVSDADAAFVTVGAIALQGVRQAAPTLGERMVVVGLGLLGQLTVQLLRANGCAVLGSDPDPAKRELALKLGAEMAVAPDELLDAAATFSRGRGVDAVLIAASTSSNQPVIDAGAISRMKGRVVVVGLVGMDLPRDDYYKKELDLRLSMAYGPGRYDPLYEEHGIDYPFAHVRWTEQRNFEAFLDLIASGAVTPFELVTHSFDFADALMAYDLLEGRTKEPYLGILLNYAGGVALERERLVVRSTGSGSADAARARRVEGKASVALIGAGGFATGVLIPALRKSGRFELRGLVTATGVTAHAVGRKYGIELLATSEEEILSRPEIDAVVISTRHNHHAPAVARALAAGKHVFVEKPLALNVEGLDQVIAAQSAAPQQLLQVGFNRRFSPLVRELQSKLPGSSPMALLYRVNAGVIPLNHWSQDPEVGGGRIVGEVCHFVDLCSALTGSEVSSVHALAVRKEDRSVPDEDLVTIQLEYASGSHATILYSAWGGKQMAKESLELFCGNLSAHLNDFRELTLFQGNSRSRRRHSGQDKGFGGEFAAFAASLASGQPAIAFESLVNTTRATFAVLESLRSGERVRVER